MFLNYTELFSVMKTLYHSMHISFCLRYIYLTLYMSWTGIGSIVFSYKCVYFCLPLFFIVTLSHSFCISICLLPGLSSLVTSYQSFESPFSVISFHFILCIESVFLFTLAPSFPFSIFFRHFILAFPCLLSCIQFIFNLFFLSTAQLLTV